MRLHVAKRSPNSFELLLARSGNRRGFRVGELQRNKPHAFIERLVYNARVEESVGVIPLRNQAKRSVNVVGPARFGVGLQIEADAWAPMDAVSGDAVTDGGGGVADRRTVVDGEVSSVGGSRDDRILGIDLLKLHGVELGNSLPRTGQSARLGQSHSPMLDRESG